MKKNIINSLAVMMLAISIHSCTKSTTNTDVLGINTFSGRMECLWDESKAPNPKAFLDIDKGMVYDKTTAPLYASEIDMIWTESSGGSIIQAPNISIYAPSTSSSPGFQEGTLFVSWNQRNQTGISHISSQTVAQYNAVTNNAELLSLIGDKFDFSSSQWDFMECTNADFNTIYYIETSNAGVKKRGYIHFKAGQKGNNNYVDFEIKIQK
jgi:hypothetical protein